MDFFQESLALGVDLVILGLCLRDYAHYKQTAKMLKSAAEVQIDGELKRTLAKQHEKRIPYAVIRGAVAPIGVPLQSSLVPGISGVLQVVKLTEHRVTRGFAGFWSDDLKLLHESDNLVPFELRCQGQGVQIVDALRAAVLDLDMVYDNYEVTHLSIWDHIIAFFSGIRQRGLQTTEQVLREGSLVTAIGELELDGETLRMQPSDRGPLFLTTETKSMLIQRIENAKTNQLLKIAFWGSISAILLGLIARKIYLRRKQKRDEDEIHDRLEEERRERRARSRPRTLNEDQLCVICYTNPKEIIILPCGHVCLCEDCSPQVTNFCPICRGKIQLKSVAFIV